MNIIYSIRGNNIISSPIVDDMWKNILKKIKEKITPLAYATWFENTKLYLMNRDEAVINVPTLINKNYLKENYNDVINEYLTKEIK